MNRFLCTLVLGSIVFAALPSARTWAQTVDPANGTWKLDLAKSKIRSGPAPQSQTRTYEETVDTIREIIDATDVQGKRSHTDFPAKIDGKDYPVKGHQDSDTVALTRVDTYTVKGVHKKDGKPVIFATRTVSKDGKTLTVRKTGTTAEGERIDQLLFYEKQ
jgi:hypothetical protein